MAHDSSLSQAIAGLDGAVADLEDLAHVIDDEDSDALFTREGAREAVKGESQRRFTGFRVRMGSRKAFYCVVHEAFMIR